MRFKEWYKGDAWYGDGVNLHMDYYNSFVIHPMLLDVLKVMQKHDKGESDFYKKELRRFSRYAEQQERMISPDGAYPVVPSLTVLALFMCFRKRHWMDCCRLQ